MKKFSIFSIVILLSISGCVYPKKKEPPKVEFKYFLDVNFLRKNDDGTVMFLIKLEMTKTLNIYVERLTRLRNHDGNFKRNSRIDLFNCGPEIEGIVECDAMQF